MHRTTGTAAIHTVLLKITDGIIISVLFYVGFLVRELPYTIKEFNFVCATLLFYYVLANSLGLYRSSSLSQFNLHIEKLISTWLGVCFLLILWLFIRKESQDYSRLIMISWMLITPVLLSINRRVFNFIRVKSHKHKISIAIIGNNETSQHLIRQLDLLKWPWIKLYGIYDFIPNALTDNTQTQSIDELLSAVKANHISAVYIALSLLNKTDIESLLQALADTTVSVYIIPDLFVSNIMKSNWTRFAGVSIVNVYAAPLDGLNGIIKRLFDITFSTITLLLIWPLLLMIAVAIKLNSKGPVLFKQRRYGLNGHVINVWKFRTMNVLEDGPHIPQATKNDVRITRLGKYLRKTSLDELPQFINVLQGTLSVVGPRPHANTHNEEYRKLITGYMLRHKIKPGITGLAQVKGWRGETDALFKMQKRVEYDLEYIQNWSLGLDVKIICLTILHGFYDRSA